ncbi:MAG: hypothetical protein PHD01_14735 [Geobacteraceae bacterium]|nr:hypothetical protein [Geobacteraceae bacterium]
MKKFTISMCLVAVMALGTNAWASLSGTLYSNGSGGYLSTDTSGGLVAINALVGQINWSVDQVDGGLWSYTYTFIPVTANKNRGPGAFAIEFGAQPTDLVWSYTYSGSSSANMSIATTTGTLQTIDRTLAAGYDSWLSAADPVGTNVDVTTTFDGIQWVIDDTAPNGSIYLTLSLLTSLAPMWGDLYMDGYNVTSNNGYGFVRNTNYDLAATEEFSLTGSILSGYIPVPGSAAVPIPPAVFLFGSGLSGLFFLRRRYFPA